jgi:hypothetical protein
MSVNDQRSVLIALDSMIALDPARIADKDIDQSQVLFFISLFTSQKKTSPCHFIKLVFQVFFWIQDGR